MPGSLTYYGHLPGRIYEIVAISIIPWQSRDNFCNKKTFKNMMNVFKTDIAKAIQLLTSHTIVL
jgi:hypothetical protein